jgi:hypothetical protein
MRNYTLQDLGMNVSGEKYILPFSPDVTNDEIVEKVMTLFQTAYIYECETYKEYYPDKHEVVHKYHERTNTTEIEMNGIYTGNCDRYRFKIVMELFRFKHNNDQSLNITQEDGSPMKEGQWMIALTIEQEEGDLLEELIELRVIPTIREKAKLTKYKYNFK